MNATTMLRLTSIALFLLSSHSMAAISQQEAEQLGTVLTPLGAQKEGNAEGSIPAWTGGLQSGAAPVSNNFLGNPFVDEKPLFVITAASAEQYKDKLTPGQMAMFERYPDSYRIPVYPSHRSAALPEKVYEQIKQGAVKVQLVNDGNGLADFTSRAYPFPIPKSGVEVVWNHLARYRGPNKRVNSVQVTPQVDGSYTKVELEEDYATPQYLPDADPQSTTNFLFYLKQRVVAPARLAGNVTLVHETVDQVKEPRLAWVYNSGQRRVRRAPQVSYDGPGTASDGMRTADNYELYNGAPDRYDWKLVGKREMYIPYNNYRLWSPDLKIDQIVQPGHINQDLARYELHRVWEVVGTLKPGARHIYAKRHMFFDEDTWALVEVDHYDGRGALWRVGEGYQVLDYQHGVSLYAAMGLYDLISGRYLAMNLINESKSGQDYGRAMKLSDFTPASLRNAGIR